MKKASAMVYSRPIWSDSQPKKGPAHAVEDAVEREREHQRRHGEAEQLDRYFIDLEVLGDGRHGRGHGEAAGRHQHEHRIQDVEHRAAQHLGGRVAVRRLIGLHRGPHQLRGGRQQQKAITITMAPCSSPNTRKACS